MRIITGIAVITLSIVPRAFSQECPKQSATVASAPSRVRTMQGTLIYHDGLRKWFELKLDQRQCGETSIELVPSKSDDWKPLEVFRNCRVQSTGAIDIPVTGYYSLNLYQAVDHIDGIEGCTRKPPFPDYSRMKPDNSMREYRVFMHVNYRPGDHPIIFRVTSDDKKLDPWQAYARYFLTGGFVLYGYCADGFSAVKVFGTAAAKPWRVDGYAVFDPESAAASGKRDIDLGYTCKRDR